jgi:hypothetical protein
MLSDSKSRSSEAAKFFARVNGMKLRQKVALVGAIAVLIVSGVSLIRGELHDAALGVFVASCALFTNFDMWPIKPLWRRRKG